MIYEMASEIERPVSEALPVVLETGNNSEDERDDVMADENRPNTTRSRMRMTPVALSQARLARTPATAHRQREHDADEFDETHEDYVIAARTHDDVTQPQTVSGLDFREDTNDSFLITELKQQGELETAEEDAQRGWRNAYYTEHSLVSTLGEKSATFVDDEEYDTDLDIDGNTKHKHCHVHSAFIFIFAVLLQNTCPSTTPAEGLLTSRSASDWASFLSRTSCVTSWIR